MSARADRRRPTRIVGHLENTLCGLKDIVCGYLDANVKRTADDLLRGEAEARPDPEPDPKSDPLMAFGAKLRGRGRRCKAEPVLESWEQVVPPEPEYAPDPTRPRATEEHEFVVRRTKGGYEKEGTRSPREQETQENAVVGVREVTTEEDVDWGFDDDRADYSAAAQQIALPGSHASPRSRRRDSGPTCASPPMS